MGNVLIVVSDTQLLGDLSDCCREEGFTPHGLTHGSFVVPWVGERDAMAVILDTSAEGVNVAALCRDIPTSTDASVFVLTQDDGEMDQLKAEELGVKAFFSKPLKPEVVFSQIKFLLA